MATKEQIVQPAMASMRFTPDDRKILTALRKKLGVDTTQIVRLAIRALATKEGVPS